MSRPVMPVAMTAKPETVHSRIIAARSLRWNSLLLGMAASGVIIFSVNQAWAGIVGLALLTGTALIFGRFDLLHPYTWYTPLFFLYSTSLPALIWVGVRPDIGSLHETVMMEWIALATFIVVVGPSHKRLSLSTKPNMNITMPCAFLFVLSVLISGTYLGYIWINNLSSKYAIVLSGSVFARLDPAFSVLALTFALLLANSLLRNRVPWVLILFTLGWTTLGLLISGERDLLFRILWVIVFLVHVLHYRIRSPVLVAMGISGVILLAVTAGLKNVLFREVPVSIDISNTANVIFGGEFITASENLQLLIHESPWPFFFGETLWWDLKRAFIPGFLFPYGPSPQSLFNMHFFPEVVAIGGGRGFTLVGEGYMNLGAAGVIIWFLLLALFVRYLYAKGSKNIMWLIVYVVSMPLVVYVTRADFANLLSQFVKHIGVPVIAIVIGMQLVSGHNREMQAADNTFTPEMRETDALSLKEFS